MSRRVGGFPWIQPVALVVGLLTTALLGVWLARAGELKQRQDKLEEKQESTDKNMAVQQEQQRQINEKVDEVRDDVKEVLRKLEPRPSR